MMSVASDIKALSLSLQSCDSSLMGQYGCFSSKHHILTPECQKYEKIGIFWHISLLREEIYLRRTPQVSLYTSLARTGSQLSSSGGSLGK